MARTVQDMTSVTDDGTGAHVLMLSLGILVVMAVAALALIREPTEPMKESAPQTSTITVSELGSTPTAIGDVVDYSVDREGGTLSYTVRDANGNDVRERMPITDMTQVTVTGVDGNPIAM